MRKIFKIGAIIIKDRKFMVVKKKGLEDYIMPGGKPEDGETPAETLKRELREELNASVKTFSHFGILEGPGSPKDVWVTQYLFLAEVEGDIRPAAEIENLAWVDSNSKGRVRLSPFVEQVMMPRLLQTNMIK